MSDNDKTELSIDGLEKLSKLFSEGAPVVHVGILGGEARAATDAGQLTNAQIGAFHEFGTAKTPQRSFLRIPLITQLDKRIKGSGLFSKALFNQALKAGTLKPIMARIGMVAEDVVLGAFDSNGYGEWAPLKPATMALKKNQQTLVETQQLRNSITNEVVDGEESE